MTKVNLAEALDINNIIKKYNKTGVMQNSHDFEGMYGQFDSFDLKEAMQKVIDAETLFLQVPSEIRNNFGNDAGAFIDYATDSENKDQMIKWGLANATPPPPDSPTPTPTPEPTPTTENS